METNNLINEINKLYDFFGDEISKKIFCNRVLYSLTSDTQYIFKIIQDIPKAKIITEKLDNIDTSIPKYIYGAGIRGRAMKKIWPYDWKGFIDCNENLIGTKINGIPVISYNNIESKKDIVVIIPNRFSAKEIMGNLINQGIKRENIIDVSDAWNELLYEQYFDLPQLIHSEKEIFIDTGSFDGLSTMQFLKWSKDNFKRVYLWEPERKNMQICMKAIKGIIPEEKRIFVNKVSWSTRGDITFTENGISSSVDKAGKEVIESSTIDDELQNSDIPTFIKMDIEGSEMQSLCGCSELIKNYCPQLAISVYHKPEDILDLPELILSFNSKYIFYLRHYSWADWDTVLYAVPK